MTGSHMPKPLTKSVILFILTAAAIVAAWWWLGAAIAMPPSPLDPGEKLYCASYAPFHGAQTPLDPTTHIEASQIDSDLAQLSRITGCIRTYSVDFGLDRVPEIARKHGLQVLLGIWISNKPERNQFQITTGIALAKQFPDVIRAVVVGNEALLRGEISASGLADALRTVKAQVPQPVTYADVWEFWLRYRELSSAVDFITIHILPYWEDFPIPADQAADHVASIRARAAAEFPGREIVIGETGWPSAGRMREGALPSRVNQARVIQDILARGRRENFRVNVIEAYDQPWKRQLEGTVGGHWGMLDDATRTFKFDWGEPVSNHSHWRWQAAGGVALAALIFGLSVLAHRRAHLQAELAFGRLIALALDALVAGVFVGWAVENALVESLGIGGWARSLALLAVAIVAPVVGAIGLVLGVAAPSFDRVLASADDRIRDPLAVALGLVLIVLCVLALQTAFGLVFDPRYRDFPFTPLTAATVPFLLQSIFLPRVAGAPAMAEYTAAGVLMVSAIFIALNETLANWQALWLCAALIALAANLARARAAPG
jgi:exo-beta-1,3-glucanase (GH17 family)